MLNEQYSSKALNHTHCLCRTHGQSQGSLKFPLFYRFHLQVVDVVWVSLFRSSGHNTQLDCSQAYCVLSRYPNLYQIPTRAGYITPASLSSTPGLPDVLSVEVCTMKFFNHKDQKLVVEKSAMLAFYFSRLTLAVTIVW